MKQIMQGFTRKMDRKGKKWSTENREIPTQTENNEVKKLERELLRQPFLAVD